jgi:hypothetical protein
VTTSTAITTAGPSASATAGPSNTPPASRQQHEWRVREIRLAMNKVYDKFYERPVGPFVRGYVLIISAKEVK